jgi:predicted site-specific integrase-resolvase
MKDVIECNGKQFYCTALLAERYGISPMTVGKWVKRGLLPEPLRLGRRSYFDRDRVDELIRQGETAPPSKARHNANG